MLANIQTFVGIAKSIKDADFAIEAVPEIINLERQIFPALDAAAPKHAILASNTSNMSITEIASSTKRPKQGVGMQFFDPAVLMRLVEVMKGEKTSEETIQLTYDLALNMNDEILGRIPKTIYSVELIYYKRFWGNVRHFTMSGLRDYRQPVK